MVKNNNRIITLMKDVVKINCDDVILHYDLSCNVSDLKLQCYSSRSLLPRRKSLPSTQGRDS